MSAPDTERPSDPDARAARKIASLTRAYCRWLDRQDERLLKTLFHEDSTVTSGTFSGPAQQFVREICRINGSVFNQTLHSVANETIEVTGDVATAETEVVAVCTMTNEDGSQSEILTGGRFLDRFERREGAWKIAARNFVCDWNRLDKTTRCDDGLFAPSRDGQHESGGTLWH